jgi:uncharacterized membrane protein
MTHTLLHPRVAVAGVSPISILMPFPIAAFTGALVTDIVYARTAQVQWSNFSAWLLAVGMAFGGLAFLLALIEFAWGDARRRTGLAWTLMAGVVVMLTIALINNFVHARDGWTAVVPTGLALSAITVALMILNAVLARMLRRRLEGVAS